jgi:2-dehydro-3-deoxyphosphogluconate aldolase/(4S)-4-hydroxy-2-oxoglutarate aldolase
MDFLVEFKTCPFLGIVRGIAQRHIETLALAALGAEMRFMEITMNTPQAPELIAALRQAAPQLVVGAGTVCSLRDLDLALAAGARFIVSPAFQEDVAMRCGAAEVPYLPGALTPTEVLHAWHQGATMVKVFPVGALGGPSYIKELRGPFAEIPLFACGGVSAANTAAYFAAGANGVALGGSVFSLDLLESGDHLSISTHIRSITSAASAFFP